METEKVFVKDDNMAVIHCTSCSQVKRINVEKFRDKQHNVRIKCPCGHTFAIMLDFRQQYRKTIGLKGRYMVLTYANSGWQKFTALNLSKGGIGMQVRLASLREGELLQLEFTLDDAKQALIKKKVIIRHICGNTLGCQFTETVEFEREIGFYLLT
jgi:c-di-GMP-binding flagellar brake protein YcgR